MKLYHFFAIVAVCLLASFSGKNQYDYVFEDQLYICMVNGFETQDYDLGKNLAALYPLLQEDQLIAGTSGKDFDAFFTKLATEDWNNLGLSEQTSNALSALLAADKGYWCSLESMGLDSAQFNSSKFAAIIQQFNEEYPVVDGKYKVFDGKEFATFYGKILSAEDLEHQYYQYMAINGFASYLVKNQE